MKRLIAIVSICTLWSLASCGGGDGTLESCVSSYTGPITVETMETGPIAGRMIATIQLADTTAASTVPRLEFLMTIDTEGAAQGLEFEGAATIDDAGVVTPGSSGPRLTGDFDLDACEGSGTWSIGSVYQNGTWRLAFGHSAY